MCSLMSRCAAARTECHPVRPAPSATATTMHSRTQPALWSIPTTIAVREAATTRATRGCKARPVGKVARAGAPASRAMRPRAAPCAAALRLTAIAPRHRVLNVAGCEKYERASPSAGITGHAVAKLAALSVCKRTVPCKPTQKESRGVNTNWRQSSIPDPLVGCGIAKSVMATRSAAALEASTPNLRRYLLAPFTTQHAFAEYPTRKSFE